MMASDTLMGLAAEAGSPLAPISVFVESFSPVFPEEARPSLIWPSIFDRSGFFNPKPMFVFCMESSLGSI